MLHSTALWTDRRGVVFLEFLICFVPIWSFGLGVFQLALISQAGLLVKHSADAAARSAAVVLPDDPHEYGGEPEMSVDRNAVRAARLGPALRRLATALQEPAPEVVAEALSGPAVVNVGRSRLNTIRLAAHVPLLPLAPIGVGEGSRFSLRNALGGRPSLPAALAYQASAVAVTFPGVTGDVATGSEITVRVAYAYPCTVPLARFLLCKPFDALDEEEWDSALLPQARRIAGGRFRSLAHETTVMLHDAPYEYRPRGS